MVDDLKSFRRSWIQHTGMQVATLTVLAATFSVVIFVASFSMNFHRFLASWGEGTQVTIYLRDEVDNAAATKLTSQLEAFREVRSVHFVPRETATEDFKRQMASYAPHLLADADFSNPFPASFKLQLRGSAATPEEIAGLEQFALKLQTLPGVEDVSYGQSWVHNYASFVATLYASSAIMAVILLIGSLFVVGNSIRSSISARRDEIEILELVGATARMIRRPYVLEGFLMGGLAVAIALSINGALHVWQKSVMTSSLVLARLVPLMSFLDFVTICGFIVVGSMIGALGAWLTVRKINDGWSAKQSLES